MKGLARLRVQPVVDVFQQFAKGASLLHAARAVVSLVADGGSMGEQHAQGDGHVFKMRIAHGIAQVDGKIRIQIQRAAFAKRQHAEGHHQLADGGDAEAGFLRYGHAARQARRTVAKHVILSRWAAQHDARAQRAIVFENGFHR